MANAQVHEQQTEERGCSFRDFSGHTFPTFDGTGGFTEAENWLNDMEELLEATRCTLEQKVIYDAYKLSRVAKRWWQAQNMLLTMELGVDQSISWATFKEEFHNHFFLEWCKKLRLENSWIWFNEG
ncbi:hypothetical protein SLA2020_280010 [Shorea laevis]